ncbi:MAG: adenylate/guanylate cyclase, partial [Acidobacteria bacterium]|nr:adenylate/guanylate cyclase [Acidobacteriota bacterium]
MPLLTIRLFGEFSATDHRGNALSIGNRKTQALIVYMALRGEEASAREAALLLFGSEESFGIRALIHELQYAFRFLPPGLVIEQGDALRFDDESVSVDAQRFDRLAASNSINSTREAAGLYHANLLDGLTIGIEPFDDWLAERRLHYWRAALTIFGRLLAAQIKAGWWESAVDTAGRLLSLDPSQEVVHRALMRLQLEQGRPDSALRRYQECVDILRREFRREPSAETERVHEEIVTALDRSPAPREVMHNSNNRPVLVLLVEDDIVSAALVEEYLQEAGYEVVSVHDGADALIEIGRREFDLLLLDINIPTLSGLRLFEIMIQKGIDTPAVFITGIAGPEVEARSLEIGAADFLRKPIRKEVLLPRIRAILQRRERSAVWG